MQDAKEEVRARLNIEDVVGEYVQLKRAGRNFKGLSPFSGEKTHRRRYPRVCAGWARHFIFTAAEVDQ